MRGAWISRSCCPHHGGVESTLACSAAAEAALLLPAGPEADGLFMCPECCVIDSGPFDPGFFSLQFGK